MNAERGKMRALFFWIRRPRWFHCGTFGWLIDLELFLQLLNQRRKFFLPLGFDLLSQRSFHFLPFLNVAGFKLSAVLWTEAETGVANRRFSLTLDRLTAQVLSLAHDVAFLRTHLHPTLGFAPEILPGRRRHCQPALTYALTWWRSMRPGSNRRPTNGAM